MQDSKQKWSRILRLIIFGAILIAILAGLSRIIENAYLANDGLVQERNKGMISIKKEEENTIDVLVTGDSLSYSSISPLQLWSEYGFTTFDCAQYGQKIQETYSMLEMVFAKQSPQLVILEANTIYRAGDGMRGEMNGNITSVKEWLKRSFPIFQNHNVWRLFITKQRYDMETYKGFILRTGIQPYESGEYMTETDEIAELPSAGVIAAEKVQQLCEEHGARLLLVSVPSPVNYNYQRHNGLAEFAEEHGLDYLDLNLLLDEVGIDWQTDARDGGDHLNLSGAQKVTEYLGTYINEHYDLPDHRNDAAYQSWNQEADTYQQKAGEHLQEMFGEIESEE